MQFEPVYKGQLLINGTFSDSIECPLYTCLTVTRIPTSRSLYKSKMKIYVSTQFIKGNCFFELNSNKSNAQTGLIGC
jgi:hypothetical protein